MRGFSLSHMLISPRLKDLKQAFASNPAVSLVRARLLHMVHL